MSENLPAVNDSGLNPSQVALITQQTPHHLIYQRKGKGGKMLSYVPHNYVTELLNSAFGHVWSFETEFVRELSTKNEMIVKGKLTVYSGNGQNIVKEQFGQCEIQYGQNGQAGMSTGDALKGAGSDALRKCASLLGIGLDLYGEHNEKRKKFPGSRPPEPVSPRMTQKQKNLIFKLSASHVWSREERQKIVEFCTSEKSMDAGTKMIDKMKAIIAERKAAERQSEEKTPDLFPCGICKKLNITEDEATYQHWYDNGTDIVVCKDCYNDLLAATPEEGRAAKEDDARTFKAAAIAEEKARQEAEAELNTELDSELEEAEEEAPEAELIE